MIIAQTLYDLFPLETIDTKNVAPLGPSEFIEKILVPEAAIALIQEDQGYGFKEEALETLRESSKYGTIMFPDLDARIGIGDNIVRSRARARRKQMEKEMRVDEELERLTSEDDELIRQGESRISHSQAQGAPKMERLTPKVMFSRSVSEQEDNTVLDLSDSSTSSSIAFDSKDKRSRSSRNTTRLNDLDATPRVKSRPKFKKASSNSIEVDDELTPKALRSNPRTHDKDARGDIDLLSNPGAKGRKLDRGTQDGPVQMGKRKKGLGNTGCGPLELLLVL